ncbi:hypothetical protein ABK040_003596 [Willaertia magna]
MFHFDTNSNNNYKIINPCTSYCEIINFINFNSEILFKNNTVNTININLINNYIFKENDNNCKLLNRYNYNLKFIGFKENNTSNITMTFESELNYDMSIVNNLSFHSLTIHKLQMKVTDNLVFKNCIVIEFILQNNEDPQNQSLLLIGDTSYFQLIQVSNIQSIYLIDCTIDGIRLTSFLSFFSSGSVFYTKNNLSQNTFSKGEFVTINNINVYENVTITFAYVSYVLLEDATFHENEMTQPALLINFAITISLKNCKALRKELFAILIGGRIDILNFYSRGSLYIMLPISVTINYSNFYKIPKIGLRLEEAQNVKILNTNFTQCGASSIVVKNTVHPSNMEITDCLFTQNGKSGGINGGAINFESNDIEVKLTILNCIFKDNQATKNGGAIYLNTLNEFSKLLIYKSKFINNQANINSLVTSTINSYEGNGGAIFAVSGSVAVNDVNDVNDVNNGDSVVNNGGYLELSDDTFFLNNKAVRGGAIFTSCQLSFSSQTESQILMKENEAKVAGGAFFLLNYNNNNNNIEQLLLNNNNFKMINNSAHLYGSQLATFIKKINVQFNNENIKVFPGLQFDIYLKAFDLFNKSIPQISEQVKFKVNFNQENFPLFQVFGTTQGHYRYFILQNRNYTLQNTLKQDNEGIPVSFDLILPESFVTINFQIIPCPEGYFEKVTIDNFIQCEKYEFPTSVIIIISVIAALLFFLTGIIVGILIIYGTVKIMIKLKRLAKKEKAEMEIEKKILDKQTIFDIDNTPLLEDDRMVSLSFSSSSSLSVRGGNNKSNKKKKGQKQQTFLIPVEELKIEKKIGEGGCGTVYSAKWGNNTVAIKSIKISTLDEEEESENDFEKEASLLSTLRHPNIVTFYGVTITDKSKYMPYAYLIDNFELILSFQLITSGFSSEMNNLEMIFTSTKRSFSCKTIFEHENGEYLNYTNGKHVDFSYCFKGFKYGRVKYTKLLLSHINLYDKTNLLPLDFNHTSHYCNLYKCVVHVNREDAKINEGIRLYCNSPTLYSLNDNFKIMVCECDCLKKLCLRPGNECLRHKEIVSKFKIDATNFNKLLQIDFSEVLYKELTNLRLSYKGIFTVKKDVHEYNINYNYSDDSKIMKNNYLELYELDNENYIDKIVIKKVANRLIQIFYCGKHNRNFTIISFSNLLNKSYYYCLLVDS